MMTTMTRNPYRWLACAAFLVAAGCEATKSENPLSPSIAGPIAGVEISAPKALEPASGWKLKSYEQPITLLAENAWTTGPRPLYQRFEIAADPGFASVVFARDNVPLGEGGRTRLPLPERLQDGRHYFWRLRAADGANTGPWSEMIQFEVQLPARVFEPTLLEPLGNVRVTTTRPTFRVRDAERQGPVGPLHYTFQVALDSGFTRLVAMGIIPEQPGETRYVPTNELPWDGPLYWRSHASDGQFTSAWVGPQTFRTPTRPPEVPPGPSPIPGISCPPTPATAFGIVSCRRAQYGTPMSAASINQMLRNVARDLNAAGIPEGPFGILRKTGGHNCLGYSCDIICSGQGNAQKQWDVLGDAESTATPGWSGPHTVPNIRVDLCEIQ
jgi:hypothetical protein